MLKKPLALNDLQPDIWFVANLTPSAANIFNSSFYPAPSRDNTQKVFIKRVAAGGRSKYIMMSRPKVKDVRIVNAETAHACAKPTRKAYKTEVAKLVEALSPIKLHL